MAKFKLIGKYSSKQEAILDDNITEVIVIPSVNSSSKFTGYFQLWGVKSDNYVYLNYESNLVHAILFDDDSFVAESPGSSNETYYKRSFPNFYYNKISNSFKIVPLVDCDCYLTIYGR